MADAAVSFLLDNLKEFVIKELKDEERYEVHDLRKEVDKFKSMLMMTKSILKDIDAKQSKDKRRRQWVRDIENLNCRIEDTSETFRIIESIYEKKIHEGRVKRFFKKITNSKDIKDSVIQDIYLKIKGINISFADLWQQGNDIGRTEVESSNNAVINDYRETLPNDYPEGQRLLNGVVEDLQLLLSSMFDESRNHRVITVCGMAGIGKTTLAEHLFNHYTIPKEFEAVAFVKIPEQFAIRIVFESTLHQFFEKVQPEQRKAIKDMEENELVTHLCNFQKKHKCLIVLDNISSCDAWVRLRIAIPLKTKSKLLITTRSLEVAEPSTAGVGIIHTMRCLTEEDAWELFNQCVNLPNSPDFKADHPEVENVWRDLVRRCKGLPLDIVAVGAIFRTNNLFQQSSIAQNNTSDILQNLTLIYFALPYELKSCFLYLASLRKGTELRTEKLYHMWMAEGFVSRSHYQSKTEMHIAESYFNELCLRSLVQEQEDDISTVRGFKSCYLHDLIHDLCLFMGRQEEFFVVMENELEKDYDFSPSTDRKQRVVFYLGKHASIDPLVRLTKNLRCLLVYNAYENQESETHEKLSDLLTCIMQSESLRILDFDSIGFGSTELPERISNLVLLRYLSFNGCFLKALPESIGNLPCLIILDLRVEAECELEIPNVLQNLKTLRHLYLPLMFQKRFDGKLRLNGLTQLETLENFNTELCDVEDLFTMTKIWYLTVIIEGSRENLKRLTDYMYTTSEHVLHSSVNVRNFDCYAEERHLIFRRLLACPALHVLNMGGHLGHLPLYDQFSKNLSQIELNGSELQIDPMPTLEKLPNLRVLILCDAFGGEEIICSASNFPELRCLKLSNLSDLEIWRVEEGAMLKLSTLVIENCSQLKMLPDGLRFLTNLRELKILKMPETFKHRLSVVDGERGADMDKVPRETSIIFDNDNESLE